MLYLPEDRVAVVTQRADHSKAGDITRTPFVLTANVSDLDCNKAPDSARTGKLTVFSQVDIEFHPSWTFARTSEEQLSALREQAISIVPELSFVAARGKPVAAANACWVYTSFSMTEELGTSAPLLYSPLYALAVPIDIVISPFVFLYCAIASPACGP